MLNRSYGSVNILDRGCGSGIMRNRVCGSEILAGEAAEIWKSMYHGVLKCLD